MTDKSDLTARENEVLALAWQCFDHEPKVNMTKLASLTGYTTGSATFTMAKIKRKLKAKTQGISQHNPTPKQRPGRPRTTNGSDTKATKRAASATPTPNKRQKKSTQQPSISDEDEDEDDFQLPENMAVKKEDSDDESGGMDNDFLTGIDEAAGF